MPRLTPVNWKLLECVFQKAGFVFERQAGSHRCYIKAGVARPIVIPTYKEVDVKIIKSNMKTAGLSREEYLKLLHECRKETVALPVQHFFELNANWIGARHFAKLPSLDARIHPALLLPEFPVEKW